MKIFVAASYSTQVNYDTGEVFPEYKQWLETNLCLIESLGHEVFCSLRADGYKLNDADPAEAFRLDIGQIKACDAMLAFLGETVSVGVQTEVGAAVALNKLVILARSPKDKVQYFNNAMSKAGAVKEVDLPLTAEGLAEVLTP